MNESNLDIIIGGIYKRIDWLRYRVEEIHPDATWYETTWKLSKSVRYEQLDASASYPSGTMRVRKIEDFLDTVEVDGQQRNIFELIK